MTTQQDILSVVEIARQARLCAPTLAMADTSTKNKALLSIANKILSMQDELQHANATDMEEASIHGLSNSILDRLELTKSRIANIAKGLRNIAELPDPIGKTTPLEKMPSGIRIGKVQIPIGVIGIIYESRPNVTADAAGLCIKSGNVVILRGGSEAIYSNCAITKCIEFGLIEAGLPKQCVQIIRNTERSKVSEMATCSQYIDVIIPRGGQSLLERIMNDSTIPIIKHLHGVCHVYVDRFADTDKAINIVMNAKTQRYGVCNTIETLLVDIRCGVEFFQRICRSLQEKGVELRVCEKSLPLISSTNSTIKLADEEDWVTEYLAPILSVKLVDNIEEAIQHINHYGSHHTDAIVTENKQNASNFMHKVDSSSVMFNASTRFADGFEYGMGAEMGISTDRLHVRGPVGLEGLTTYKYLVFGDGHIRK